MTVFSLIDCFRIWDKTMLYIQFETNQVSFVNKGVVLSLKIVCTINNI